MESLLKLESRPNSGRDTVEAAALPLHSFYTGVERMLLLVSRVVNGGTPSLREGCHRRLLERMAISTETRPAVLPVTLLQNNHRPAPAFRTQKFPSARSFYIAFSSSASASASSFLSRAFSFSSWVRRLASSACMPSYC